MGNIANRFRPVRSPQPLEPIAAERPIKPVNEPRKTAKRGPKPSGNAKQLITLRLDPAVLAHYRATGEGWQTRINDDLVKLNGL